jgi:protocatechuate 3,4-dioxygenase beta subunit
MKGEGETGAAPGVPSEEARMASQRALPHGLGPRLLALTDDPARAGQHPGGRPTAPALVGRRAALMSLAFLPLLRLPALAQGAVLELTPECRGDAAPTVAQTEGPYFRPGAPLRRDLAQDAPSGQRLQLGGLVLDTACRPVDRALVELWHADDAGRYDGRGFRMRGHQFTDARGAWSFTTIVPAPYRSRTRHYHVKVQRPNGPVLTTQLYFPDEPGNRRDRGFDQRLVMRLTEAGGLVARYDFVVA